MMNHTRISRILTLVVILSSTFHIYSYISLVDLKGLYTCMNREYERFSPAYGALYWLSDYTQNLYDFGYKESPIVKFTRQLFFRQTDGAFDATRSPMQLAYHFNTRDWGSLVGWINEYKGYLAVQKKVALEKATPDQLQQLDAEKNTLERELTNFIDGLVIERQNLSKNP